MADEKNQSPIVNQQLKVIGMFKDASPSGVNPPDSMFKSNPQFAFDIKNMRFSPLDGPSMFDIVNEKGNKKIDIQNITTPLYEDQSIENTELLDIKGTPIGINTFNNELLIFTTEDSTVPVIIPTENSIYQFNTFQLELVNNFLTARYELIEVTENAKNQSSDITTIVDFSLIDLDTNIINDLQLVSLPGELIDVISSDLSDYTYSYIFIKAIKVYYKYNTVDSKLLYKNIIGLSYLKSTTSNTNSKYTNRIFNLSTVTNIAFPNYSTEQQFFVDSTSIDIISKNENTPNIEVINGELIADLSEESNFIFSNKENFQNSYKYISFDTLTSILTIENNNYPETLPEKDFIVIYYNKDTIVESMEFFFEGEITLDNTGFGLIEFNRITNIGSIEPDEELIKTLQFDYNSAEALFTTFKSFTFKQVEITINNITEIYSNNQPGDSLITNWSKSNTENIIKEGTYTITIKSL